MGMKPSLKKEDLLDVIQSEKIESASWQQVTEWFRAERGLADFAPDGVCQVDPRDGSMVIYNASRAKRPHDNRSTNPPVNQSKSCPICEGKTTGVLDIEPLSSGFTFINKNLFPCVYPFDKPDKRSVLAPETTAQGGFVHGLHLLQWTSSEHDRDWHNMPLEDLVIVIDRLAALEKWLLEQSEEMPATAPWNDGDRRSCGFVSIIKNVGAPVGGSLTHGHQQIVLSNTMPTGTFNNWRFKEKHHETFSEFLQRENAKNLEIVDYGESVLLVPYFMKRPYFAMLLNRDTAKQHLWELTAQERRAVAKGWSAMAAAYTDMLPQMGREAAYNVLVHTGPGAGVYLEFLPFTQETGGYEQLGLWVCQGEPVACSVTLKKILLG